MDTKSVSADLIRRQGEEMLGLGRSEPRSQELAGEVERLNLAVAEAAEDIEFDDEPLRYAARLREMREARSRGR